MGDVDPEDLVIGRISGVYGIKGWVRIHSFTEPVENLLSYRDWKVRRRGQWKSIVIDDGKRHGKGLVAHIEGVDDRDEAAALKGLDIAVPRSLLPALQDEEYYWHQLEGLSVMCGGELLGRVDHLIETGANDVLVVKPCTGSRDEQERLLPWLLGTVVTLVDLQKQVIEVDWDPEF
ncbi:MAG: ribosome maturation factor RimM [Halieaceae bacterium]